MVLSSALASESHFILKSTVRTVIALANKKQGQSYTFEPSTTFFVPCACFHICFQTFLHVNKLHTNRKDINRGILLNLEAVYVERLFSNWSFAREGKLFTPFTSSAAKLKEIKCPSESTESLTCLTSRLT